MNIRVERQTSGENEFIGEFEADQVPAPGDTFWHGTQGPYEVSDRAFIFGNSEQTDRPEGAILIVKAVRKGISGQRDIKGYTF